MYWGTFCFIILKYTLREKHRIKKCIFKNRKPFVVSCESLNSSWACCHVWVWCYLNQRTKKWNHLEVHWFLMFVVILCVSVVILSLFVIILCLFVVIFCLFVAFCLSFFDNLCVLVDSLYFLWSFSDSLQWYCVSSQSLWQSTSTSQYCSTDYISSLNVLMLFSCLESFACFCV